MIGLLRVKDHLPMLYLFPLTNDQANIENLNKRKAALKSAVEEIKYSGPGEGHRRKVCQAFQPLATPASRYPVPAPEEDGATSQRRFRHQADRQAETAPTAGRRHAPRHAKPGGEGGLEEL